MGGFVPTGEARVEIKRMRVAPDAQRQGLGASVLEALEWYARARGVDRVHLDTTSSQTAARSLYTSRGYREVSRGQRGPFEMLYYEKSLGESP